MNHNIQQDRLFSLGNINSTRLFVMFQGILAGFAGIVHGISETSKGNTPTGGFILVNVGAFTIIHNYLYTGIATIIVALSITFWTIGFIHKNNGSTIFLILSVLLFLVGGGVAQVLFLIITWGVSTRIDKPLIWCRRILPEDLRKQLANLWLLIFIIGFFFLSVGIGIWLLLLPPGIIHTVNVIDYICWTSLSIGLLFQILTIVSGFARDIERKKP